MKFIISALLVCILTTLHLSAQIRINEVCASNYDNLYDEDSDTPDWIELYNYSNEPVNLKDWRISDKNDVENAWQLPDTIIQPNNYLVVFASDKNKSKKNIRITSNGISTAFNDLNDNLSMLYLKLEGNNEFKVKFNSYKFILDTNNIYSNAGIILKDKLEPNSKMISLLFNHENIKNISMVERLDTESYRNTDIIDIRNDLENLSFAFKIENDSVKAVIYDINHYPVFEKYFYFPKLSEYFVGITLLSRNINEFQNLNIESIELNNNNLNLNQLETKNFYNTSLKSVASRLIHTDFKLSKKGDSIFLFNDDILKDSVLFSDLDINETLSFREGSFYYTNIATPGSLNSKGFSKKSKMNFEDESIFFADSILFSNIDNQLYYTDLLNDKTLDIRLNNSIFYNSNVLKIQKTENNVQSSTIKYLPLIKEDNILNDKIHVFLNTDSFELFNKHYGLISATYSDKRVKTYCTITKGNELLFNDNVEMAKHGNLSSVGRLQNSLRLYFNDDIESLFGNNLFQNKTKRYGSKLNIRNAGNDFRLYIRDLYSQYISANLNLEWSDHTPAFVYLNNEFWGLYNIRERIDDNFIAKKYGIESNKVNIFQNDIKLKYGTNAELLILQSKINILSQGEIFNYADSIIDLNSFIDYLFSETFVLNHDWLVNNVEAWSSDQYKWKFILNDLDFAFKLFGAGPSINSIDYIFEQDSIFLVDLFQLLLKTDKFKFDFFNRVCDLINTDFSSAILVSKLDKIKTEYAPFIEDQNKRWPETVIDWSNNIGIIYNFIEKRQDYYLEHCNEKLNSPGISKLNLVTYPPNGGTFKVNTITIDTSEWTGRYFQTIPVTITAIPKHGMKFVKWNHDSLGLESTITTTLPELMTIEAIYEEANVSEQDKLIVINEIMYNADKDEDTKDWIELYNAGTKEVNLNGWSLIDEDITHEVFEINEDYLMQPDEYVILTKEKIEFEKYIIISNKVFGDFDFGLGGNDKVVLMDSDGTTHDSVNYDNDEPWPIAADGTGLTIELTNPTLDNNRAINWKTSQLNLGTPGKINSNYDSLITSIKISSIEKNIEYSFINNVLSVNSDVLINQIELSDISGKKILDYKINSKWARIDLSNIPFGVYLGSVVTEKNFKTIKLIINK